MTQPNPAPDALASRLTAALRRGIGLLLLLLPLWFNPWAALPFEPAKVALLRWSAVLLILAAGLGMALSVRFRRESWAKLRRVKPAVAAGLCYAATFTLAGIVSSAPGQSFWGLSDGHGIVTLWAQITLFLLVVVFVHSDDDRTEIVRWLLLGSVPVSLYGLAQAAGWDSLAWQSDSVSPVLSTLGRSNFLGAYLALLLPFSLVFARRERRGWLLIGLHSLCLLLTLARAAWLAGVTGALLTFWWMPTPNRTPRPVYRGVLLAGATLALALFFWLGEQVGNSQIFHPNSSSTSDQSHSDAGSISYGELRESSPERRWIIWRAAWPLIGERPLLGYGPEMFVIFFNQRYPPGSLYTGTDVLVDDPHNQLLEHLLAAGAVGAVAWLLLLGILAWHGVRRLAGERERARLLTAACLGSLIAYLVQAQLNPDVVALSTLFWVMAGLTVASSDLLAGEANLSSPQTTDGGPLKLPDSCGLLNLR